MVVEQLSDCFKVALALTSSADGTMTFTVQSKASLQQSKRAYLLHNLQGRGADLYRAAPRPEHAGSPARPTRPPPYSLPQVFTALNKLGSLSTLLHDLQTRLIRDILTPIASSLVSVNVTPSELTSTLRLALVDSAPSSKDRVDAMSQALSFLSSHAFLPTADLESERSSFLQHIQHEAFSITLRETILPAMPSTLSSIPSWLELVQLAASIESRHRSGIEAADHAVILPFFESEAGRAWATQRRKRVAEETRKIILGGWGGWEAVTQEKEKEVVRMVEVEVRDEEGDPVVTGVVQPETVDVEEGNGQKADPNGNDFGWGFDDEAESSKGKSDKEDRDGDVTMTQDNGWGFDESANQAGASKSKPSQTNQPSIANSHANGSNEVASEGDGWGFDLAPLVSESKTAQTPASPVAAKPAREAKRLGKKVAKIKSTEDDDLWGSGTESVRGSPDLSRPAAGEGHSTSPTTQMQTDVQTTAQSTQNGADDWSWGDEPPAAPKRVKKKRKVLREEKRTIKETFLISRACEKILNVAERVLKESSDLDASRYALLLPCHPLRAYRCDGPVLTSCSLSSPSFVAAGDILLAAARDVFDIYRSLLPTHFAIQIRDVPTLAMQMYNDARHLSQEVIGISRRYPRWLSSEDDLALRLNALADHAFESQLMVQKESLMESLTDVRFDEVGREAGLKNAERALSGVVHNIDSLSRVLKASPRHALFLRRAGDVAGSSSG